METIQTCVKCSKMKLYCISDLHFGVHANSTKWLDILLDWTNNWLTDQVKRSDPDDILFIFGDIFENRQSINVNVQQKTKAAINRLSKLIKIHILLGNHDVYYADSNEVTSMNIFDDNPNMTIYSKPQVVNYCGIDVLVLPWDKDPNSVAKIAAEHAGRCRNMFGHMDVNGMIYDNTRPVLSGMDRKVLKDFDLVALGHIHWRQTSDNILYLGSPYHTERSDIGNDKGLHILSNDGAGSFNVEFVRNGYSPVFDKIEMSAFLEMPLSEVRTRLNNNFIDINVSSDFIRRFSPTRVTDFLKEYGIKCQNIEFPPYTLREAKNIEEVRAVMGSMNMADVSKRILSSRGYSGSEVDASVMYFMELESRLKEEKARLA